MDFETPVCKLYLLFISADAAQEKEKKRRKCCCLLVFQSLQSIQYQSKSFAIKTTFLAEIPTETASKRVLPTRPSACYQLDHVATPLTLFFVNRNNLNLVLINFQTKPLLVRVDTKAGHGFGKPTSKVIEEITEIFCFLVNTLGYKFID